MANTPKIWKLTYKNFIHENGKLKTKVKIKFLEAFTAYEAKKKLDLHFSLIMKCEDYHQKIQRI